MRQDLAAALGLQPLATQVPVIQDGAVGPQRSIRLWEDGEAGVAGRVCHVHVVVRCNQNGSLFGAVEEATLVKSASSRQYRATDVQPML